MPDTAKMTEAILQNQIAILCGLTIMLKQTGNDEAAKRSFVAAETTVQLLGLERIFHAGHP